MLEENKVYTYKYRYRFIDGHTSRTCQPVILKTTSTNRVCKLDIKLVGDLDSESLSSTFAKLEVYRKEGSTGYRLLETIDPDDGEYILNGTTVKYISFKDDGKVGGGELDDLSTTSTKSHRAQTEVQDRIVKGNVSYKDRSVSNLPVDFTIASQTGNHADGDVAVPSGANVQLYGKAVFDDNQESFHFPLSNQLNGVKSDDDIIFPNYVQGDIPDLKQYGYDDLSLYLRIKNDEKDQVDESAIPFNTIEVNNINVPTLETWNEDPSFNNFRPHVFLGWKYVVRAPRTQSDGSVLIKQWVIDDDFDENPPDVGSMNEVLLYDGNFLIEEPFVSSSTLFEDLFPQHLNLEVVNGQTLPYHRHVYCDKALTGPVDSYNQGHLPVAIYKLSFADALKVAIEAGNVKVRLKDSAIPQISSTYDVSEYLDYEADVVGYLDTSFGTNDFFNNEYGEFTCPNSSRIYLVLDNDNIYNEVDMYDVVNSDIIGAYDEEDETENIKDDELNYTLGFDLLGVGYEEGVNDTSQTIPMPTDDNFYDGYQLYEGLEGELNLVDSPVLDSVIDQMIYVGSFNDDTTFQSRMLNGSKLKFTGFEYVQEKNLNYVGLVENNLFETIILRSDIDLLENDWPNQLVWSQPTTEGTAKNNSRTFLYSNFLNVGTEYGEILSIESLGNNLVVFCERGVALIRVGAKLANQSSGDIYIDSSQFLSSPQWQLKGVPSIQPSSIVSGETAIFFVDGRDAWMFNGKFKNISSGAIDLDGYCVGGYDPENKEYRVSVFPEGIMPKDSNSGAKTGDYQTSLNTYGFSIELGEWMGAHNYGDVCSVYHNNEMVSVLDVDLVKHNRTNKFNGRDYETVIESTANDLNDVTILKRYRRFYLDVIGDTNLSLGDLKFEYASDYFTTPKVVDLSEKNKVNGLYKIGFHSVSGRPHNSRVVFWRIRTVVEGFVLNGLSFSYLATKR